VKITRIVLIQPFKSAIYSSNLDGSIVDGSSVAMNGYTIIQAAPTRSRECFIIKVEWKSYKDDNLDVELTDGI